MKAVSRDQSHEVIGRVMRNTNWSELDGDILQQGVIGMSEQEFGRRFTQFLKNGANFVMKGPGALIVDRTKPFDTNKFLPIWRGPKDGNGLTGEEEQDTRSLKHTEIDFAKAIFTVCLKDGESAITGEEKLARHTAAKHIRLDAKVGQDLLEEKGQATLEWLFNTFGIVWFELPGTTLRYSNGRRYFLCLYRDDDDRWRWSYYWLDSYRYARNPSAVLAS